MPVREEFSAWCRAWHTVSAQDMVVTRKTAGRGQSCHRLISGPTARLFSSYGLSFPAWPENGLHSVVSEESLSPAGLQGG